MADEQLIDEQVIEEVAETARRLTSREAGFFFAGAGLGVAAGFALGYFGMHKRVEAKYDAIVEKEIDDMRKHYRNLESSLRQQVESRRPLEELVVERGYTEVEIEAINETVEKETRNVFEDSEQWSFEEELAKRDPEVPYIIHYTEFQENIPDNSQSTLTYYEADDVLADERDQPIEDMDEVIGLGNLGRWGHGSNDPNTVHIRNERLGLDIELCRDPGSFEEQTSGTIRHSSSRRRRPMRRFDDDD